MRYGVIGLFLFFSLSSGCGNKLEGDVPLSHIFNNKKIVDMSKIERKKLCKRVSIASFSDNYQSSLLAIANWCKDNYPEYGYNFRNMSRLRIDGIYLRDKSLIEDASLYISSSLMEGNGSLNLKEIHETLNALKEADQEEISRYRTLEGILYLIRHEVPDLEAALESLNLAALDGNPMAIGYVLLIAENCDHYIGLKNDIDPNPLTENVSYDDFLKYLRKNEIYPDFSRIGSCQ